MVGFSIRWALPGDFGQFGDAVRRLGNTVLPAEFTARWEFPEDHCVELDIAVQTVDVGGTNAVRPFCQAIRIERNPNRPPLDGTEVRRLPLRNWIEFACTEAGMRSSGRWGPVESCEDRQGAHDDVRESGRRRRITKEFLLQVADVFEEKDGGTDAVQRKMYVSKAQAYRYVREARKRGFLPEVQQ